MRLSFGGLAAAGLALAMSMSPRSDRPPWEDDFLPQPGRRTRLRRPAPNDEGPVVDTTPESKRARRRRLARERRP